MAVNPLLHALTERGWTDHYQDERPSRPAQLGSTDDVNCPDLAAYLRCGPSPYVHQTQALASFVAGDDVCLSTGTASGKTRLFHGAHVRSRAEEPKAVTLALYPMKSLGVEQEARWRSEFPEQTIGRIDGDVQGEQRKTMLKNADVLVCTPDIWHASLLAQLHEPHVRNFLRRVRLIVIDEAHTYTGVFGSNSAFLFRRLQHAICHLAGCEVGFVAASATLKNPDEHLRKLTGREFTIVGPEMDGAPQQRLTYHLVKPPENSGLAESLTDLIKELGHQEKRFLAFADSRKMVELVADIVNRDSSAEESEDEEDGPEDLLERHGVLPYRSGYENEDRLKIQSRLTDPKLRGIVATSAMELGLDIPNLDTTILIGVPNSATSLHQRVGRVGRSKPGEVIVVYSGTVVDQYVFDDPAKRLLHRPLQESALYLDNLRVQYIHAMCLARSGGENEALTGTDEPVENLVSWPDGFLDLCERERTGQLDGELQSMKGEAGDQPHRTYPLRTCEKQFTIHLKQGGEESRLGSLTYAQALREAYPGGMYLHAMRRFRVHRVDVSGKQIYVRPEKRYTTKPAALPIKVMPNMTPGRLRQRISKGALVLLEGDAQVREAISGFKEVRGRAETTVTYPLSPTHGISWSLKMFSRQYASSGIYLFHPALNEKGVKMAALNTLFIEALLLAQPFERNDLGNAPGRLDATGDDLTGQHFLSVFDSTNGSLRLSARFLDDRHLEDALSILVDLAGHGLDEPTQRAVEALYDCAGANRQDERFTSPDEDDERERIILPKSIGWSIPDDRQEFVVEELKMLKGGLHYRGALRAWLIRDEGARKALPVAAVEPEPGVSKMGWFVYESGDILPDPE